MIEFSLMLREKKLQGEINIDYILGKKLKPEHIPKVSKRDTKLMFASLSQREFDSKEVQKWTKRAIQHCDLIWDSGSDFNEEFDLPSSQPLRILKLYWEL